MQGKTTLGFRIIGHNAAQARILVQHRFLRLAAACRGFATSDDGIFA